MVVLYLNNTTVIYLVIYLLLSDAKVAKPLLENEKFKR